MKDKSDVKRKMLKMLSNEMRSMGNEEMEIPKKAMQVTVASDSKEGLKKGLSKAEEIMKMRKKMGDKDNC